MALSWTLFALLALFWTGAAWLSAAATQWLTQALAMGAAAQTARDFASFPLPEWLKFWLDPAWLQALRSAMQWGISGVSPALAGTAAGWLVTAIWIAWGLGIVLLLLGATGVHTLLRRFARGGSRRSVSRVA